MWDGTSKPRLKNITRLSSLSRFPKLCLISPYILHSPLKICDSSSLASVHLQSQSDFENLHDYKVPFNAHPTYVGVEGKGVLHFLLSPPGKAIESQEIK